MPKQSAELDNVFSALADPTRRKIIEKLRAKNYTVVELSSLFNISLPAVSKHLKVLDNARLLDREKDGRFIVCSHDPRSLNGAIKWISKQYQFWNEGFNSLEKFLDSNHKEKKTK